MPSHTPISTVELGGGTSVTALLDATTDHRRALEECFPGEPRGGWAAVKDSYPETVGVTGRWRLPFYMFLVRTPELTMLVDCGVGCGETCAAAMFGVSGRLPDLLAELALGTDAIDLVAFTHFHDDHLGWATDPTSGVPTFGNARYLLDSTEWQATHAGEEPPWVAESLDPLERRSLIERVEPGPLAAGIELAALPGHAFGHSAIVVTGAEERLALVGDAFNHPLQVADPEVPSIADGDRPRAVASRREVLARARSGEWTVFASAHLPGPWWRVGEDGGWRSVDAAA